ncbi:MAG: hypothetical protein ACLFP2_06260 [Candidatus Woesearchaeota archaeon]
MYHIISGEHDTIPGIYYRVYPGRGYGQLLLTEDFAKIATFYPYASKQRKQGAGINQALANITLLPDLSFHTGVCSRPEPIYYPQPKGVAQVPVSQFTRSQLWKDQQVYPLPIQ